MYIPNFYRSIHNIFHLNSSILLKTNIITRATTRHTIRYYSIFPLSKNYIENNTHLDYNTLPQLNTNLQHLEETDVVNNFLSLNLQNPEDLRSNISHIRFNRCSNTHSIEQTNSTRNRWWTGFIRHRIPSFPLPLHFHG